MEIQLDLIRHHREQTEKLVYYIIALSVTAIGFSVMKTTGMSLKYDQIPLGIAVFSWGLSIYIGLRYLKYNLNIMRANYEMCEIEAGHSKNVVNDPQSKKSVMQELEQITEHNGERMAIYFKWQEFLFYFGIIMFLTWHIIEMSLVKY